MLQIDISFFGRDEKEMLQVGISVLQRLFSNFAKLFNVIQIFNDHIVWILLHNIV